MFKRLYVDNYKCLVNFDLEFQDLTLLLGRNGTGKTSVLDDYLRAPRTLERQSQDRRSRNISRAHSNGLANQGATGL